MGGVQSRTRKAASGKSEVRQVDHWVGRASQSIGGDPMYSVIVVLGVEVDTSCIWRWV
jgi:hypothetical protein